MSAKILDLDPAQRLRRQTAEVMQKCSVDQIMDLLKDWEKIHRSQGYADGEQAASDRLARIFADFDPTSPNSPSAA